MIHLLARMPRVHHEAQPRLAHRRGRELHRVDVDALFFRALAWARQRSASPISTGTMGVGVDIMVKPSGAIFSTK
jgi:hypothetical protein